MFRSNSGPYCSTAAKILLAVFLTLCAAMTFAAQESTIFGFDGQDFVRLSTTLTMADGSSAVNTKLDRNDPSYTALMEKHSYTGDATIDGRDYDANYAPLIDADGQLTGAIFVGNSK